MKIKINNINYDVPGSLSAVTLQQRIDFDITYGKDLRKQLAAIHELKDEQSKELEFTDYHCKLACHTVAFFAGIPLEVIYNTAIEDVMAVYHGTMDTYSQEVNFSDENQALVNNFSWNDEQWEIASPALNNHSKMTFGELIQAKASIQNMMKLGNEQWESLLPLCCVYFRKKDEAFTEAFMDKEGDRYQLMKTLPLTYALQVAFFLSVSQISWLNTFQYSKKAEDQAPGVT